MADHEYTWEYFHGIYIRSYDHRQALAYATSRITEEQHLQYDEEYIVPYHARLGSILGRAIAFGSGVAMDEVQSNHRIQITDGNVTIDVLSDEYERHALVSLWREFNLHLQ